MAEPIQEPNTKVMTEGMTFALETIVEDLSEKGQKVAKLDLTFTDKPGQFPPTHLVGKVSYAAMVQSSGCQTPVEGVQGHKNYFFDYESEKGWYRTGLHL